MLPYFLRIIPCAFQGTYENYYFKGGRKMTIKIKKYGNWGAYSL